MSDSVLYKDLRAEHVPDAKLREVLETIVGYAERNRERTSVALREFSGGNEEYGRRTAASHEAGKLLSVIRSAIQEARKP